MIVYNRAKRCQVMKYQKLSFNIRLSIVNDYLALLCPNQEFPGHRRWPNTLKLEPKSYNFTCHHLAPNCSLVSVLPKITIMPAMDPFFCRISCSCASQLSAWAHWSDQSLGHLMTLWSAWSHRIIQIHSNSFWREICIVLLSLILRESFLAAAVY